MLTAKVPVMAFIRPEAAQTLWKLREVIAGMGTSFVGLILALGTNGILSMVGGSLTVVGTLMLFVGFQRARFRIGTGGPGMVQVIEGQVTYFGPFDGGTVSVGALEKVELEPTGNGEAHWLLTEAGGQPPLRIPTDAEGGDALFDVFASLEGLHTERMLAELRKRPNARVTIWKNADPTVH